MRSSKYCLIGLGALLLGARPPTVLADVVWLLNGDRITGDIQSLDAQRLLVRLPNGNDITLSWPDVQTLRCDTALLVRQDALQKGRTTTLREAASGTVMLDDGEAVSLNTIDSFTRPITVIGDWRWQGHIDVDFDSLHKATEDSSELSVAADMRGRHVNWRHHLTADSAYETKERDKTKDQWSISYALDRVLTPRWFWRAHLKNDRDQLASPWLQREIGTGPGYRLIDTVRGHFELIGELVRMESRSSSDEDGFILDTTAYFNAVSLGWDWQYYAMASALELYSTGIAYKPDTVTVDARLHNDEINLPIQLDFDIHYAVQLTIGARYYVTQMVYTSLRYKYEHTEGEALRSTDQRTYFGIGLKW